MKTYLKTLIGVSVLQFHLLVLHAQQTPYRFSVPIAPGASVAPVIPDEAQELIPPIRPLPPQRFVRSPPINFDEEGDFFDSEEGFLPSANNERSTSFLPKDQIVPDRVTDILDFWFGLLPNPAYFPKDKMLLWFSGSPESDRQIRENFTQDVLNAMRGDYNSWRETPKGRLALILLLDQFPRHIYRNTPHSFMFDRMARALVLEGIQKGDDKNLYPIERAFFYLPLEHAEDPEMQGLSVASFRQLLVESPMPLKQQMQSFLQFAILHQQQIDRFGRFPHRNRVLGRESSPEEAVFLNQWDKLSF